MSAPVIVVEYDTLWPLLFAEIRDRLAAALGSLAQQIEHIGSTSVPDLPGKPIIDIYVVVADRPDVRLAIDLLAELGYDHEGQLGVPGREAFRTPAGAPPHHLYVCPADCADLDRVLTFRDQLRADGRLAERYAELKLKLAARHRDDHLAYNAGKTAFVDSVVAAAWSRRTEQVRRPALPA